MSQETKVGRITHYFSKLSVAIIKVEEGSLKMGDEIHIKGATSDFTQKIESMEIDHQAVNEATAGQEVGIKVIEHARENDAVYKVEA